MCDNRNMILAVVLSAIVLLGWQYFIAGPQLEKARIAQEARTDQKNLDHVIKDLKNAEKAHQKAIKVRVPSHTTCLPHPP